jgi:hypothetical protein
MLTTRTLTTRTLTTRTLPAVLLTVITLAACGAAAGPSSPPAETPAPPPTAVPGPGGIGGGSSGNTGGGVVVGGGGGGGIVDPAPGLNPILGQAQFVTPVAGLIDQHPVSVQLVRAAADDQGARAELRWWSGVAPCNVLDSVQVDTDEVAHTIKLTVIEGSAPGEMACIDIAQLKATTVDLGKLAAGTWTISATGDAPSVELEVA